MLIIREEQTKAFKEVAEKRYKDKLKKYLIDFYPKNCEILGDEKLKDFY